MRIFVPLIVTLAAGCAATPPPAKPKPPLEQQTTAAQIEKICSLPEAQRKVELEKLKKDSGLILYCGK